MAIIESDKNIDAFEIFAGKNGLSFTLMFFVSWLIVFSIDAKAGVIWAFLTSIPFYFALIRPCFSTIEYIKQIGKYELTNSMLYTLDKSENRLKKIDLNYCSFKLVKHTNTRVSILFYVNQEGFLRFFGNREYISDIFLYRINSNELPPQFTNT